MDLFLYNNGLRYERVKIARIQFTHLLLFLAHITDNIKREYRDVKRRK